MLAKEAPLVKSLLVANWDMKLTKYLLSEGKMYRPGTDDKEVSSKSEGFLGNKYYILLGGSYQSRHQ